MFQAHQKSGLKLTGGHVQEYPFSRQTAVIPEQEYFELSSPDYFERLYPNYLQMVEFRIIFKRLDPEVKKKKIGTGLFGSRKNEPGSVNTGK